MSRKAPQADPLQQLADGFAQHLIQQFSQQNPDIAAFFNMNVQEAPAPPQQQRPLFLRPGAVIKDAEFTIIPKKRT